MQQRAIAVSRAGRRYRDQAARPSTWRIAQAKACRQQIMHDAARILGRAVTATGYAASDANRLAHRVARRRRGVGMFALVIGIQQIASGIGDAALAEHHGDFLAAAIAEVGNRRTSPSAHSRA